MYYGKTYPVQEGFGSVLGKIFGGTASMFKSAVSFDKLVGLDSAVKIESIVKIGDFDVGKVIPVIKEHINIAKRAPKEVLLSLFYVLKKIYFRLVKGRTEGNYKADLFRYAWELFQKRMELVFGVRQAGTALTLGITFILALTYVAHKLGILKQILRIPVRIFSFFRSLIVKIVGEESANDLQKVENKLLGVANKEQTVALREASEEVYGYIYSQYDHVISTILKLRTEDLPYFKKEILQVYDFAKKLSTGMYEKKVGYDPDAARIVAIADEVVRLLRSRLDIKSMLPKESGRSALSWFIIITTAIGFIIAVMEVARRKGILKKIKRLPINIAKFVKELLKKIFHKKKIGTDKIE